MSLNKRNPEIYKRSRCVRCNRAIENWTHIWICKENYTIINQIISKILKDTLEKKDIKIDHRLYMKFWMTNPSMMIFNGRIFHEAIKGLVNERLFCGFKDK
jgi:hypothetical protein